MIMERAIRKRTKQEKNKKKKEKDTTMAGFLFQDVCCHDYSIDERITWMVYVVVF